MSENKLEKILKNKNCRGCSNRCSLLSPGCNRSKIYIEEEAKKVNIDSKENDKVWENIKLF